MTENAEEREEIDVSDKQDERNNEADERAIKGAHHRGGVPTGALFMAHHGDQQRKTGVRNENEQPPMRRALNGNEKQHHEQQRPQEPARNQRKGIGFMMRCLHTAISQ